MSVDRGPEIPPAGGAPDAEGQLAAAASVKVPAICLIVLGALSTLAALAAFAVPPNEQAMSNLPPNAKEMILEYSVGTMGVLIHIVLLAIAATVLLGAVKMLQMRSHGLAVAASIAAMVNLSCCCCVPGIPIGIWALVVLMRPEVKAAFR